MSTILRYWYDYSNTMRPAKDGSPKAAVKTPLVPYQSKIPAVNGVTQGPILPYMLSLLPPAFRRFTKA